jgi:hypothetical protein
MTRLAQDDNKSAFLPSASGNFEQKETKGTKSVRDIHRLHCCLMFGLARGPQAGKTA